MPRDRDAVRRRLQEAAIAMFDTDGYGATTAAGIAMRAGVTERTFFRHFPDKREVLFGGEAALSSILMDQIHAAPPTLAPWPVLFQALEKAVPFLSQNRLHSRIRRRVIADNPPLQERELAKTMVLTTSLANALQERGSPEGAALLAASLAMAVLARAFAKWLDAEVGELSDHLHRAFREAHALIAPT